MTSTSTVTSSRTTPTPGFGIRVVAWLRTNLFSTWYNSLITVLIAWAIVIVADPFLRWLTVNSVVAPATADVCRQAQGACWAFIQEKYRLILFGLYPYDQQWRPAAVLALFAGLCTLSCFRRFWTPRLLLIWLAGLVVVGILMWGGILGMPFVENRFFGGLPLTIILSIVGLAVAFPIAILLALGRRSNLPVLRSLSVIYIELIRGVPLISLLFMASVMFPLFLPQGVTVDKLLRAQVAFIMFAAAYMAEIVRAGLQTIPRGQYEAADALGLSYWQKHLKIVLPQALVLVIPPLVNTFIDFFKDTSLVVIIGLFDLMSSTKASLSDAAWRGFFTEAYLVAAVIYWVICFFMSRFSQRLEHDLNRNRRH
ncbi:MAG: amino acid ABC transporter permease [Azospirillaceae bacterium]|nr:amino acid ABC transporter permease [Azospirillaceae bacterium]